MQGRNTILNERGASSWDLVLKTLSILLVALFAFSSGVWFGKKLSDSDHQRMALEGEFDKEIRKTASVDAHGAELDDHEALTDEEVAAAADKALAAHKSKTEVAEKTEAVHGDAHGEAHGAPATKTAQADAHGAATAHSTAHTTAKSAHGETAATAAAAAESIKPIKTAAKSGHGDSHEDHGDSHAAAHSEKSAPRSVASTPTKPDLSAAHQAAVRVANNAVPVGKEKAAPESRVPSSLPKTIGATNDVEFTVQVASYPSVQAAKDHVESLVKKGFPAFPVEAKVNGKTYYRVSVGSFKSFGDASKFRAQLLKQADLSSAIVQKVAR